MPYKSEKQRRWAHTKEGREALDTEKWDEESEGKDLPEEASAGKGPARTQGPGKKVPDTVKQLKRISREQHKGMPTGGPHGTKKGKKGYTRKQKHKDLSEGEELTPIDETYRNLNFPVSDFTEARPCGEGEDPRIGHCNPSIPPESDQEEILLDEEYVPNENLIDIIESPSEWTHPSGRGWERDKGMDDFYDRTQLHSSKIVADLSWSTHKSETFEDTGEKGDFPAWGLKSIIDRGIKPHEKSNGDKKIHPNTQTQKRIVKRKNFKSFSHVLYWD